MQGFFFLEVLMKVSTDGHQKESLIGSYSAGKSNRILSSLSVKWGNKSPQTTAV